MVLKHGTENLFFKTTLVFFKTNIILKKHKILIAFIYTKHPTSLSVVAFISTSLPILGPSFFR